jgi:hypothetical protein
VGKSAADGPLLIATAVYVIVPPAAGVVVLTLAWIDTSASLSSSALAVAVLLAGFASMVVGPMDAVLSIGRG